MTKRNIWIDKVIREEFGIKRCMWRWILERCNCKWRPAYKNYWGRGIKCKFKNFEEFARDIWPRPWPKYTVERIDNNWDYEPWNVRWATRKEQSYNRRSNVLYRMNWKTLTVMDWSKELNMRYERTRRWFLKWKLKAERVFKS